MLLHWLHQFDNYKSQIVTGIDGGNYVKLNICAMFTSRMLVNIFKFISK